MSKELISTINRELNRISCAEITFHAEQERLSIQAGQNRISWPHPIGLEQLANVLSYLPANASVETVSAQLSMYSLGWDQGRERMLENEAVRQTYYQERWLAGLKKPTANSTEIEHSPAGSDLNDLQQLSQDMDQGPDELVI